MDDQGTLKISKLWFISYLELRWISTSIIELLWRCTMFKSIFANSSRRFEWMFVKKWQCRKKWDKDSMSKLQESKVLTQMEKSWENLWLLRWQVSKSFNPVGLWILKIDFGNGWLIVNKVVQKDKMTQCCEFWNWAYSIHLLLREKWVFKQISSAIPCRHMIAIERVWRNWFSWGMQSNKYFGESEGLILSKVQNFLNQRLNLRKSSPNSWH